MFMAIHRASSAVILKWTCGEWLATSAITTGSNASRMAIGLPTNLWRTEMRRREFIAGLGGAVAWPVVARAQPADRVRRIGVLSTRAENTAGWQANRAALLDELAKLGRIEGRNVRIEFRFGAGHVDAMRAHAAELVGLAPDVIVTNGNAATRVAQQATQTIPIVMAAGGDPAVTASFATLHDPRAISQGSAHRNPRSPASGWSCSRRLHPVSPELPCSTTQKPV
jgi:hypothetical protein